MDTEELVAAFLRRRGFDVERLPESIKKMPDFLVRDERPET
jgi:hypothetical protein